MYRDLVEKKKTLAVIGLGYVGLPIALAFAKKIKVIGFDVNADRVKMMREGKDPGKELSAADFDGCDIQFTDDIHILKQASFFIVAVPTPIDEQLLPDLRALLLASETIGRVISKGDYVIYESTVYPGCTIDDCVPVIEQFSGLKMITDYKIGYSPERINPGDKQHTLAKVTKVVSGCCEESLEEIAKVYALVVEAGIHRVSSIKVAEAAKIIENTQRDLNIALMNELSVIFDMMNIDTYEVLEAAGTKWNFLPFRPGLVGGHCIGVDPYYLTYKSKQLGYDSRVILAGRHINDSMAGFVAKKVLQHIIQYNENVKDAKVLIMGATFKENVTDIRNSKVADIVKELQSFSLKVEISDPYAAGAELKHEYGFGLVSHPANDYDAIIITVPHEAYKDYDDAFFASLTKPGALIYDIKGTYRNKIKSRKYKTL